MSIANELRTCQGCGTTIPVTSFPAKGYDREGNQKYGFYCGKAYNNCYTKRQDAQEAARSLMADEDHAIIPERTGLVSFHGTQIRAAVFEGEGWTRLSDACGWIGILEVGQIKRLLADDRFRTYLRKITEGLGAPPAWYIHGSKVPGWIQTINANKVSTSARQPLLWLQSEFDKVLHAWVTGDEIPASPAQSPVAPEFALQAHTEQKQEHKRTQKMIEDLHDHMRGATLYKDRLLIIRGSVYLMRLWPEMSPETAAQLIDLPDVAEYWRRGYRLYCVGMTSQKTQRRMDTYAKKPRMRVPVPVATIDVDSPEEAEKILKRTAPKTAIRVPYSPEHFWCKPADIEGRVRSSWIQNPTLSVEDMALRMRGWVVGSAGMVVTQPGLFDEDVASA